MDSNEASQEEVESLRVELADWRRRAEMAEAVAAERLARAQMAERALGAAEAALRALERSAATPPLPSPATAGAPPVAAAPAGSSPAASTRAAAGSRAAAGAPPRGDAAISGTVHPQPQAEAGVEEPEAEEPAAKSLREWWRRYTDSLT